MAKFSEINDIFTGVREADGIRDLNDYEYERVTNMLIRLLKEYNEKVNED